MRIAPVVALVVTSAPIEFATAMIVFELLGGQLEVPIEGEIVALALTARVVDFEFSVVKFHLAAGTSHILHRRSDA